MTETQVPEIWKAGLALEGSEAGMGGRNMSNNHKAPTHPFPGLLPLRRVCSVLLLSLFFLKATHPRPDPSVRVNDLARNQQLCASGPRWPHARLAQNMELCHWSYIPGSPCPSVLQPYPSLCQFDQEPASGCGSCPPVPTHLEALPQHSAPFLLQSP